MDYKAVRFEERYRQSKFDVVLDTIGGALPNHDPSPVVTLTPMSMHATLIGCICCPGTGILSQSGSGEHSTSLPPQHVQCRRDTAVNSNVRREQVTTTRAASRCSSRAATSRTS